MTRSTMPLRRQDLDLRQVGTETIAYDAASDVVSALSVEAAAVFAACDGVTTYTSVAAKLGSTVVDAALVELGDAGLLVGSSRRTLLKRTAVIGAGAMVVTMAAPLAGAHASGTAGGGGTRTTTRYDLFTNASGAGRSTTSPFAFFEGSTAAPSAVTTPVPTGAGSDFKGARGVYDANAYSVPFFITNTTGGTIMPFDATVPNNSFATHPPQSGYGLIRFTNPDTKTTIHVTAAASSLTSGGDGVTISLVTPGGTVLASSGSTRSGGASTPTSLTYDGTLATNGVLYLQVDSNTGGFGSDSTGLSFTVTTS